MMLRAIMKSLIAATALLGCLVNAEDIRLEWKIQNYPNESVEVGDTLTFFWNSGTHNVHINPDMNCASRANAENLGGVSEVSYTFTDADAGTDIYFACFVGSHCNAGQHVTVSVAAAAVVADTDAPTPSPVDDMGAMTPVEPTPSPVEETPDTPADDGSAASFFVTAATGAATLMLAAALL